VINSSWHHILYRFGVIAAYRSNFGHFAFLTTYDVQLGLIGKRVVDLILVLIKLFARCYGWVATNESISKIGDFAPTRSVWSKISGTRGRLTNYFYTELGQWMPYNCFADSFHTKKLCSRLSSSKVRFTKIGRLAFSSPSLGDLETTYDVHLKLIGKRTVDFLLVLMELFSLAVTAEALRISGQNRRFRSNGTSWPKLLV